jgi:succinate-acetate transporter protein
MRDFLMLGMGMVAMLIVWGIYTLVMLVISWF